MRSRLEGRSEITGNEKRGGKREKRKRDKTRVSGVFSNEILIVG